MGSILQTQTINELTSLIWIGVAVIWFYVVLWTIRDIYTRSDNVRFQLFCALLVLVASPVIGLPIYLLIRPVTLKDDQTGRQTIMELESITCNQCMKPNLIGHDYCVFCGGGLKIHCKNCKEMYPHTHHYCFKCGAPNLTWKE